MDKLSMEDVNKFAIKKNIILNEDELSFTYNFVKKNWNQILSNPNMLNLDRFKNNYSLENFNKIKLLFNEYYKKYHNFI